MMLNVAMTSVRAPKRWSDELARPASARMDSVRRRNASRSSDGWRSYRWP